MHERLRTIALLQSKIRDLANRIIVFHEALMKQKKAFHQLVYVQSMPKTYVASLDEVARRRRFGKRLSAYVAKVSENLTKMREQEIEKRKAFLNTYGRFIPRDLVPGLTGSVPPFEIHFPSFDTTLPAVDNDNVTIEEEEEFTMVLSDEKSPRVQDLEKENEKLISELKQLKSDLGTSQGINSETNEMIYKLKADLVHSQESVTDYTKRIELLESKLSTTYSQMERVEGVAKQFKEKYESAEKQLENIRMEYMMQSQELTQNTQKLEKQLAESQLELEALRQRLAASEQKLREYESKERAMTESGKQMAQRLLVIMICIFEL
jgi:septation ring formation regulator EzrA